MPIDERSVHGLTGELAMSHAIIRGKNGRRHEVNFGDDAIRVEIYSSEETVEIFIEADFETLPDGRRRFAILNVPRHLLAKPPPSRRDVSRSPRLKDLGNCAVRRVWGQHQAEPWGTGQAFFILQKGREQTANSSCHRCCHGGKLR